jgi:hypothetical protein
MFGIKKSDIKKIYYLIFQFLFTNYEVAFQTPRMLNDFLVPNTNQFAPAK